MNQARRFAYFSVFLVLVALAVQATADITQIPKGGTVFIGEEGLNLSPTGIGSGTRIFWWPPGEKITESAPAGDIVVSDPGYFDISTALFGGMTGPWYLPDNSVIFYVQEPYITIRLFDLDADVEVTDGWVPRGDSVWFRVDTNMFVMRERPEAGGVPVTFNFKTAANVRYIQLVGPDGEMTWLKKIPVNSSPYVTGPIWDTGNSLYPHGKYTIYLETDPLNSEKVTVLVGDSNPSIEFGTIGQTPAPTRMSATATTEEIEEKEKGPLEPVDGTTSLWTSPPTPNETIVSPAVTIPDTQVPVTTTTTAPLPETSAAPPPPVKETTGTATTTPVASGDPICCGVAIAVSMVSAALALRRS